MWERLQDNQLLLHNIPEVPDLKSAGQTVSCVLSGLALSEDSLKDTMMDCGGVSAGCAAFDFGNEHSHEGATMPFPLGGLGLRSETRTRHPAVAERILIVLQSFEGPESTRSALMAAHQLETA